MGYPRLDRLFRLAYASPGPSKLLLEKGVDVDSNLELQILLRGLQLTNHEIYLYRSSLNALSTHCSVQICRPNEGVKLSAFPKNMRRFALNH
jgi:hypothetical protein